MTDRELLEKAAKAAGYVIESFASDGGCWAYKANAAPNADGEYPIFKWNPLTDDGDALRLAVQLGIQPHYSDFTGNAYVRWDRGEKTDAVYGPDDPYAATRRAIVRAAAALTPASPDPHA